MIDLHPLGDRGFLAEFATEDEAAGWVAAVQSAGLLGVVDVVLAYETVAVHADPDRINDWETWAARLRNIRPKPISGDPPGRLHRIPVVYDGPDLIAVADAIGASPPEVVVLHSARDYRVFAVGFQPGFPYAGYLDDRLGGLPRRASPRVRVPAGSVAIAGRQTGIYPVESPGGWHLLGRTPLRIVDLAAGLFPIAPGDRVRFEPIGTGEFLDRRCALS